MTRSSIARRTTVVGAGTAALEIIAGAKGFWLRQLDLTLVAATASAFALGRPAVAGITPTAPVLFPLEGALDRTTMSTSSALAWGTGPTVPVTFYRQASLPAAIGAQLVWVLAGVWIPALTTIVLWNVGANSAADVNVHIDEAS